MTKAAKGSNDTNDHTETGHSPKVVIVGEGRDEWKDRYFKLEVEGSNTELPPYSIRQLISEREGIFTDLGNAGALFLTPASQKPLITSFEQRKPEKPSFTVVTRLGWHGSAFVLPDLVIGKPSIPLETSFGGLDPQILAKYREKGTLQDWQDKIGSLCVGNSRLLFAVSLALTGPVLRFVKGPRSGGFQFYGPAETSKTTAAMVAGSVWGCHRESGRREKGFLESWNSTGGKVEITALAHNDITLFLDDTKLAGKSDSSRGLVVDVSFHLAEYTEKERLTNRGSARSWRCYFLSTSNLSLPQIAANSKIILDDADRGRIVDIPLPAGNWGIYENVHGFDRAEDLADRIKNLCGKFYGVVGRDFVRHVVQDVVQDRGKLRTSLERRRRRYRKQLKRALAKAKGTVLTPLNRASGRFATVFAAGCLGIKYGILPWDRRELLKAILSCQLDGLRPVPTGEPNSQSSKASLRKKLVDYLRENNSQFMDLDQGRPKKGEHEFGAGAGYAATFKNTSWLYLSHPQLTSILGKGDDVNRVLKELAAEGVLATEKSRYVVQRQIFAGLKGNKGWESVHAFKASIIEPSAADEPQLSSVPGGH